MPVLSKEEKERILRSIETDREFRYALMGLLGFSELVERFTRLEERQQKLEERFTRLEERQQKLEEEMREIRRIMLVVSHRFGILTEAGFREAMKYIIRDVFGVGEVEKWEYTDRDGQVYGYPSVVEVDVLIRDEEHILVEVKSRVSRGDVTILYRKGVLYERVKGVKPKLVILGGFIDKGVYEASEKLGVEIKPIMKE